MNAALLMIRIVFGLGILAHSSYKLFGWFGGLGLAKASLWFESIGFRPGRLFATTSSVTEIASGLLLILGLFGPVGPSLMLSVMIVAVMAVRQNGIMAMTNGIELPMVYGTVAFALTLTGPGRYSLDAMLGLESIWTPTLNWGMRLIGIVGGLAIAAIRRPPARATATA